MAKFKDKDIRLGTDEEVLLGDSQEASIKYSGGDIVISEMPYIAGQDYLVTKSYVDNAVANLEWKDAVLSATTSAAPGSPDYGDRYIVPSGGSGAWSGHDNEIAEYTTTWGYLVPSAGFACWVVDESIYRVFDGSEWIRLGSVIDHGVLDGLADDDHAQYLRTDATRELSADWDIGDGRYIAADEIRARDNAGLILKDDAGTLSLYVVDGGVGAKPYVGIGDTTVQARLHVREPTNENCTVICESTSSTKFASFRLITGYSNADWSMLIRDNTADLTFYNAIAAEDVIEFETSGNIIPLVGQDLGDATHYWGNIYCDTITVSSGTNIDHGDLIGLSDDDHSQYLLADGSRAVTGTLTVGATGGYVRFSGVSGTIGLNTHTDLITVSPSAVNIEGSLTVALGISGDIDHGSLLGLADDDHTQYLLADGSRDVSGDLLPATSDTYDLGHSDAVWDNIWCKTLHASAGSIELGSISLADVGGVLTTTGDISAGGQYKGDVESTAAGVITFPYQSGCRVTLSGNQTISGGAWYEVEFDTEGWDIQNEFNTGTYRFTANEPGYYQVNLGVYIGSVGADKNMITAIYKNGVAAVYGPTIYLSIAGDALGGVSDIVYLNGSTDYIHAYAYHSNAPGDTKEIDSGSAGTFMSIQKVA